MQTQGPFALTAGTPLDLIDPQAATGNTSVALQIQNQTGFTIAVSTGVDSVTIQPLAVRTITIVGGGTDVVVTPTTLVIGGAVNALTVVWLLAHDTPPMADGALTIGTPLLSVMFHATGGTQSLTVPGGTTSMVVDMAGAAGGSYVGGAGGKGGRIQATIPVIPGEVLTIAVAQAGTAPNNTGASNPGGFGVAPGGAGSFSSPGNNSGSGGGASGISRGASVVLAAGGGGGCGINTAGGVGGGSTGGSGATHAGINSGVGGGGGTQAAGGTGGAHGTPGGGANGTAGSSLQGGDGGGTAPPGGGGGGGFFGGGGGGSGTVNGGGGGGGSDFVSPSAVAPVETPGFQAGDGYVTLTYSQ